MKETVQSEYIRRLRKTLSSQLHGRQKIMTINEFAFLFYVTLPRLFYWTKSELQVLDRKTRKIFTMNGGLHPQADEDRIYVHCSMGGRGLLSVEDTVISEHFAFYQYLKDHRDVLKKKVDS